MTMNRWGDFGLGGGFVDLWARQRWHVGPRHVAGSMGVRQSAG